MGKGRAERGRQERERWEGEVGNGESGNAVSALVTKRFEILGPAIQLTEVIPLPGVCPKQAVVFYPSSSSRDH